MKSQFSFLLRSLFNFLCEALRETPFYRTRTTRPVISITTFMIFSAASCFCKFTFAEVANCSGSLAASPILGAHAQEPKREDVTLGKNVAVFLKLLEVLLEDIGNSKTDSLESKLQLMNFAIQSATPMEFLTMFPTEPSRLLALLQKSEDLRKLASNISLEEWKQIQDFARERRGNLQKFEKEREVIATNTEPDFVDSPDMHGRVRLHSLLANRQYEEALILLKDPKTTTRYINTRDRKGKTPLDFFEQWPALYAAIKNRSDIEEELKNPNLFEGDTLLPIRVAEVLIAKSAMTGEELDQVDINFLRNPLNRPNKEPTYPKLEISELADLAADNLSWFYEIGGNLDAESRVPFQYRLTKIFVITNHAEGLKKLKVFGADLHLRNNNGRTLLHEAAAHGAWELIPFLVVEGGLDINASDNFGESPIIELAKRKLQDAMKIFSDFGALDHRDSDGDTPAHYYAKFCWPDHLRALVRNGANLDVKNKWGLTPLNYFNLQHRAKQEILGIFFDYFVSKGVDPRTRGLHVSDSNPPVYSMQEQVQ